MKSGEEPSWIFFGDSIVDKSVYSIVVAKPTQVCVPIPTIVCLGNET